MLWLVAATASSQSSTPRASERDWISVDGTVVATQPESFRVDYGKGVMTVTVPSWDWLRQGRSLIDNHRVTVYGRIEGAKEQRKLVAAGVYDRDLGTYFDVDGESHGMWTMTEPLVAGHIEAAGRVARIEGRELVLQSGTRVDTRKLPYDPLDDKGYPQIRPGDTIKVSGYLAKDILEQTEVVAAWIVKLQRNGKESP